MLKITLSAVRKNKSFPRNTKILAKRTLMQRWKNFVSQFVKLWICNVGFKLVSAIFYIFIFSQNDSPYKTMKNVFLFHLKSFFFVLEIFKFLFFPFLSTFSRLKKSNGSGIIYDVMNWLALICKCNFWNNSKTALNYIIKLGQIIYNE